MLNIFLCIHDSIFKDALDFSQQGLKIIKVLKCKNIKLISRSLYNILIEKITIIITIKIMITITITVTITITSNFSVFFLTAYSQICVSLKPS